MKHTEKIISGSDTIIEACHELEQLADQIKQHIDFIIIHEKQLNVMGCYDVYRKGIQKKRFEVAKKIHELERLSEIYVKE